MGKGAKRIPSDAPTALIAPSNSEHNNSPVSSVGDGRDGSTGERPAHLIMGTTGGPMIIDGQRLADSGSHRVYYRGKRVNLSTAKYGIVGAGDMTKSLITRLINSGQTMARDIFVADDTPDPSVLQELIQTFPGINCSERLHSIFGTTGVKVIFIAIHTARVQLYLDTILPDGRPQPLFNNTYIPDTNEALIVFSLPLNITLIQMKSIILSPFVEYRHEPEVRRVVMNGDIASGSGHLQVDVPLDDLSVESKHILLLFGSLTHTNEFLMAIDMNTNPF